jgi:hypothetical protein
VGSLGLLEGAAAIAKAIALSCVSPAKKAPAPPGLLDEGNTCAH